MTSLSELEASAPSLAFDLADGTAVIRLGLIITLYFRDGYTLESKRKINDCFTTFRNTFSAQLKGQMYKRYERLTDASFEKASRGMLNSGPNEQYHWQIGSAKTAFEVSEYTLSASNSPEIHGDNKRSYIKVNVPWRFLSETHGVNDYHAWVAYLCEHTNADHGYGGLSAILPYDFDSYSPMEYQLALQHSGLEIDSLIANFKRQLLNCIKGVNWYTIISDRFVDTLGGADKLRSTLSPHHQVKLFDYTGGIIIRAGDFPELGGKGQYPESYVAVNRVVKPLRIRQPDPLCPAYGDVSDAHSSARWYARFDEQDTPAVIES